MTNTVDITNLTDAALDALLDVKTGADFVDASKLTKAERYSVAEALGWEMNATTRAWCENDPSANVPRHTYHGLDVEGMILEEQEDEGNNV